MDTIFSFQCQHCAAKLRLRNYLPGDEIPNCPSCKQIPLEVVNKLDLSGPPPAHIGSVKSKAVDETYKAMEAQYGITDMRDNLREGDVAAPPLTAQQREMKRVWDANQGAAAMGGGMNGMTGQGFIDAAKMNGGGTTVDDLKKITRTMPSTRDLTQVLGKADSAGKLMK